VVNNKSHWVLVEVDSWCLDFCHGVLIVADFEGIPLCFIYLFYFI
jgi:hypothetical protein